VDYYSVLLKEADLYFDRILDYQILATTNSNNNCSLISSFLNYVSSSTLFEKARYLKEEELSKSISNNNNVCMNPNHFDNSIFDDQQDILRQNKDVNPLLHSRREVSSNSVFANSSLIHNHLVPLNYCSDIRISSSVADEYIAHSSLFMFTNSSNNIPLCETPAEGGRKNNIVESKNKIVFHINDSTLASENSVLVYICLQNDQLTNTLYSASVNPSSTAFLTFSSSDISLRPDPDIGGKKNKKNDIVCHNNNKNSESPINFRLVDICFQNSSVNSLLADICIQTGELTKPLSFPFFFSPLSDKHYLNTNKYSSIQLSQLFDPTKLSTCQEFHYLYYVYQNLSSTSLFSTNSTLSSMDSIQPSIMNIWEQNKTVTAR
jgi:hypothetical protein